MEPADEGTLNPALIRLLILPLVFLRVFAALELQAQQPVQAQHPVRGEFCLVWYNVENLFHPEDDPGTGDDEFTPGGKRNWTWSRYRNKLTAIARVIVASGRGEAPEMVGLCEVENALVLEDLCAHPILGPYRYGYLHKESPDHRGMDVACLIRMGSTEVLQWENMAFRPPVTGTRDLMHICLKMGGDTLDLFLVHLLSKYGGAGATAELRRVQCGQLAAYMDSVHTKRGEGWMMAVGDFNEVYRVAKHVLVPSGELEAQGRPAFLKIPDKGGHGEDSRCEHAEVQPSTPEVVPLSLCDKKIHEDSQGKQHTMELGEHTEAQGNTDCKPESLTILSCGFYGQPESEGPEKEQVRVGYSNGRRGSKKERYRK